MKDAGERDDDLALLLRAVGHPVRISILRILAEGKKPECCCTDVAQCLPLAQSTVSQHIKVLLDAGLIARLPQGTRNCYALRQERLAELEAAFGGLLAGLERQPSPTTLATEST